MVSMILVIFGDFFWRCMNVLALGNNFFSSQNLGNISSAALSRKN
jgi:hypothetical protein